MTLTIAEIFEKIAELRGAMPKIKALKELKNKTALRILQYTYDPSIQFNLPDTPPPYTPFKNGGAEGVLTAEYRRLAIFVKDNPQYTNAPRHKIERVFIEILEAVDHKDAELLVNMIAKKPIKGITRTAVKHAFPEWFGNEPVEELKED